jgi:hypothetical protein
MSDMEKTKNKKTKPILIIRPAEGQKASTCLSQRFVSDEFPNYKNDKHAYAGQLNSFTHQRALLVLHDRGILGLVS